MRLKHKGFEITVSVIMTLSLAACASLYTSRSSSFNISGIYPEERSNGYILKIEAAEKVGNVEAWIGEDNWLYLSIPDTSINVQQLNDLSKCPIVSRMKFFRYAGSVQVTIQLNQKFDQVGVLNYPGDNNVYVVLYRFKSGS